MINVTQETVDKTAENGAASETSAIDFGEYRAEDLDPRIKYPSYKSFDEFIDIERLKSLDSYLTQKISRHMQAENDLRFYTGPYRLQDDAPDRPGSRMIYLASSSRPDSYFDLDKTEYWSLTEHPPT